MNGLPFWTGQTIYDLLFTLLILQFGVLGLVSARVPGFFRELLKAVAFSQESVFFATLHRYIRPRLFVLIGRMQNAMLLTISFYLFFDETVSLSSFALGQSVVFLILLFLILLLFFLVRRLFYALFGYLYFDREHVKQWQRRYDLLEWIWGIMLYLVPVIAMSSNSIEIAFWLFISIFILWRIVLLIKTFVDINVRDIGYLQLLLYLCSHEFLPFVYLLVALVYSVNNNELLMSWQLK